MRLISIIESMEPLHINRIVNYTESINWQMAWAWIALNRVELSMRLRLTQYKTITLHTQPQKLIDYFAISIGTLCGHILKR